MSGDFTLESEFQSAVCDLARKLGCLVFHPQNVKRSVPGFPDLTICGREAPEGAPPNVLFRELKMPAGRVSDRQAEWIAKLDKAGADVAVWRPEDWPDRIAAELKAIA
jgi:hypothetical protein